MDTTPRRIHRGLDEPDTRLLSLAVGAGVALASGGSALLWLDNLSGPFGEHRLPGIGAALLVGGLLGSLTLAATYAVGRRSRSGVVTLVATLVSAGVVLLPARTDRTDSFVDHPNQRSTCTGWTFRHYPVGVMDGSSTTYCVGVEHPAPVG